MKKGKITDIEIACLKGMIVADISVADMADQLDRNVAAITKSVTTLMQATAREELFINKTASGKAGVSVMTPAASVKVDEAKNAAPLVTKLTNHQTFIHKIRPDEK